jgi:hypothetical protein
VLTVTLQKVVNVEVEKFPIDRKSGRPSVAAIDRIAQRGDSLVKLVRSKVLWEGALDARGGR